MKSLPVFCSLLILVACTSGGGKQACRAKPQFFCEVFAQIDAAISEKEKEHLRHSSLDSTDIHFAFAETLKNSFHLEAENDLTRYFHTIRVEHPDTMSWAMIEAYVAYLNGKEADLPSIVQHTFVPPSFSKVPHH